MRYEARAEITHLPGIADPQGATVERSLPALGYDNVSHVRVGKSIRLVIDALDDGGSRAGRRDAVDCSPIPSSRRTRSSSASWRRLSARAGIVLFPGTNCELDVAWAVEQLGGTPRCSGTPRPSSGADAVVVPGGFAHGDYLRTGAIARSPVMDAVARFAAAGGPVVGICNGFQVLTEAGAPGALQKNAG